MCDPPGVVGVEPSVVLDLLHPRSAGSSSLALPLRPDVRPQPGVMRSGLQAGYTQKIEILDQYLAYTDNDRHASVNLVYDNKAGRRFYQSTGRPKRTEQNLTVRTGKSETSLLLFYP